MLCEPLHLPRIDAEREVEANITLLLYARGVRGCRVAVPPSREGLSYARDSRLGVCY
jgi:hypothetical protein